MRKDITQIHDPDRFYGAVRAKIQGFLDYVEGTFRLRDVYEALGATTTEEKAAIRKGLSREKGGTIESTGSYGIWRKMDRSLALVDLSVIGSDTREGFCAELPLSLGNLFKVYPGDLIVVAGLTNAGKSSFALEFGLKNLGKKQVTYLSSELTREQIQTRAGLDGIKLESLKDLRFAMREGNYQDVVTPDEIYIIDYIQAPGSAEDPRYYAIPQVIAKVHGKMNGTGLLLICLQKDPGSKAGEGGFKTLHRANLYLTLDKDDRGKYWANIQKCKSRSELEGYRLQYELMRFGLEPLSDWIPPKR